MHSQKCVIPPVTSIKLCLGKIITVAQYSKLWNKYNNVKYAEKSHQILFNYKCMNSDH